MTFTQPGASGAARTEATAGKHEESSSDAALLDPTTVTAQSDPTAETEASSARPLVQPDQLTFTVLTASDRQPLAKRFWLDGTGELQTETVATFTSGEATVEHAPTIAEFVQRLERLETHEAVLYGIAAVPKATVVTQKRLDGLTQEKRRGVIARTREWIQFAQAPGIAMLDFDASGAPQGLLDAVASPDRTRELLIKAVPELAEAPMLWRPSSSSYLYDGERELRGLRGQRVYIPVTRASDVPTLGSLLYERLWLLGYGHYVVSASGQLLDRTLLDGAVWQPERLDFAAGPICVAPVARRLPAARLWKTDAPFFDVRHASGLTAHEQRAIEAKRTAGKAARRDAARERRDHWARERGKAISAKAGVPEEVAITIASEAVEHRILRPDFLLHTEDGEAVPVGELLANPNKWHQRRFCDPLEPDYRGDRRIAYANLRPGTGRPFIFSHAHGGMRFTLNGHRPTIRLVNRDLPRIVDRCAEIIAAEDTIYQLKDQIARITDEGRLAPVVSEWLTDWLQRRAEFERLNKTGGWVPADLSPKYANTILAKRGEMGLPNLVAITPGPFLRPDGSVVDQPGYDPITQVLYASSGPKAPTVRRDITLEMAEEDLRQVWEPFSKFPFVGDVDRGSVLALLLTAAVRPGIPIAPAGLIESHEAGSGKTLCARAIANLTGVPAVPQAIAQQEEEIRKALFAAARAGMSCVLFDNVGRDRSLDSASLAMALTSGGLADRVLGESTYATVPFRSLILLTGNNARIAGDLNRRVLRARITPNVENPWRRVFDFCPRARTEATWLSMRVALLELIQVALADGSTLRTGGSGYPDWDRLVRETVCWLTRRLDIGVGFADPVESLLSGYEQDPERDRLARLLPSWRAIFEDRAVTVNEMVARVANPMPASNGEGQENSVPYVLDQLRDILAEIDPHRSTHAIGIYISQQKGRIVGGLELVSAGKRCGSSLWAVKSVAE